MPYLPEPMSINSLPKSTKDKVQRIVGDILHGVENGINDYHKHIKEDGSEMPIIINQPRSIHCDIKLSNGSSVSFDVPFGTSACDPFAEKGDGDRYRTTY